MEEKKNLTQAAKNIRMQKEKYIQGEQRKGKKRKGKKKVPPSPQQV